MMWRGSVPGASEGEEIFCDVHDDKPPIYYTDVDGEIRMIGEEPCWDAALARHFLDLYRRTSAALLAACELNAYWEEVAGPIKSDKMRRYQQRLNEALEQSPRDFEL